MRSVSVSDLKARLSNHLRHVQEGEEVLVTDRGRPIARMSPVSQDLPEHLKQMAREGKIRLGTGTLPKGFWDLPSPKVPDGTIERLMREERGD